MTYTIQQMLSVQDCDLIMQGLHALFVWTDKTKEGDINSKEKLQEIVNLQSRLSHLNLEIVYKDAEVWFKLEGISPGSLSIDELEQI